MVAQVSACGLEIRECGLRSGEVNQHEPTGGIIDIHQCGTDRRALLKPTMLTSIDLYQLTHARATQPGLLNFGWSQLAWHPQTCGHLDAPDGLLGKDDLMALSEFLGRQRWSKVRIALAQDADASGQLRGQISAEQSARASVASELALAWGQFRAATTESGKQAILAEISQLQAQNQVMDARRRAMLDDLDLSDRQARTDAAVRSKAADEQLLAESALLKADAASRVQGAEAQRMATLQKQAQAAPAADYSGIRLWTTADAGGQPQ